MSADAAQTAFWTTAYELWGQETVDRLPPGRALTVWVPAWRDTVALMLNVRQVSAYQGMTDYQVRKQIDAGRILTTRNSRGHLAIPTLPLLKAYGLEYMTERPRRLSTEQRTSVYLYRDAAGQLIYVGITCRGPRRAEEHSRWSEWFHLATSCTLEHYDTRAEAEMREDGLIKTYHPPFNRRGNPSWSRAA